MGTDVPRTESIDLGAIGVPSKQLSYLDDPFIEDELWNTIKAMPKDKAPGPDGFTVEFYQSAWPIIKADLLLAINAFNHRDNRGIHNLNISLITLLPKKEEAKSPSDYRPICLIHSFGKIVAKMMARRVAPELNELSTSIRVPSSKPARSTTTSNTSKHWPSSSSNGKSPNSSSNWISPKRSTRCHGPSRCKFFSTLDSARGGGTGYPFCYHRPPREFY